jgi:hypothetical protein
VNFKTDVRIRAELAALFFARISANAAGFGFIRLDSARFRPACQLRAAV